MSTDEGSPRRTELLEASYRHVLRHGLTDLSLRPLAEAVGSSPRVLLYLFGSKDGLVEAVLARARVDELEVLTSSGAESLHEVAVQTWSWLAAEDHRGLLRLWFESFGRSLRDDAGPWTGFARRTVDDWLERLAASQVASATSEQTRTSDRTIVLAVLRGGLADLLATEELERVDAAVRRGLDLVLLDEGVRGRPTS